MKVSGFWGQVLNRLHREDVYSQKGYWNAKAEEYRGTSVSMWPNACLNELYHAEQMRLLKRWLTQPKGKRILDIGCGIGRVSRALAEQGAHVVGLDFSDKSIAIARSLSAGADNPDYVVRSIFEIADIEAYDVITVFGVVTVACRNRSELSEVLRRLRRALKPGGELLMIEPIHRGFLHRVLNLELTGFLTVVKDAGFLVREIDQLHFWPARLSLAFFPWPGWLTAVGYRVGQAAMKLPGFRRLGDYKAIRAVRAE